MKINGIFRKTALTLLSVVTVVCFALFGMNHVTQSAHRFVQFVVSDLSIVNDGHNVINVINRSGKPQKIRWLEVFVDGTDGATPVVTA